MPLLPRQNSLPRLTIGSDSTMLSGVTPRSGCSVPTTTRTHSERLPELRKPLSTVRGEPQTAGGFGDSNGLDLGEGDGAEEPDLERLLLVKHAPDGVDDVAD